VNTLSEFQVEPRHEHWIAAKHILRYICGTITYGLRCASNIEVQLHGFTDSDWQEVQMTERALMVCISVWDLL
jgi:hypothetical protein